MSGYVHQLCIPFVKHSFPFIFFFFFLVVVVTVAAAAAAAAVVIVAVVVIVKMQPFARHTARIPLALQHTFRQKARSYLQHQTNFVVVVTKFIIHNGRVYLYEILMPKKAHSVYPKSAARGSEKVGQRTSL